MNRVVLIRLRQAIDDLLSTIGVIGQRLDSLVNQEPMVKRFMKAWKPIVKGLRKSSIAQYKSTGKIKVPLK